MLIGRASIFLGRAYPAHKSLRYFVDATNGLDTNSGLSELAPWKTLAKVNGFTFLSGSSVFLKRGESWAEMLTIPSHGLYIGAYGVGAAPIITGSGARDHCVYSTGKNNITIENIKVVSAVWEAIDIESCTGAVVKNCITDLTANNAIYMTGVNGFDIDSNAVSNGAGNGIGLVTCVNGQIRRNTVTACGQVTDDRSGISIYLNCANVSIHDNVSHTHTNAGAVGVRGIIIDTCGDNVNYAFANTCYLCDGAGIVVESSNNQWVFYNVCYQNGSASNWNDGIKFLSCTGGYCYNNTCYFNKNSAVRFLNSSGCAARNNIGWQLGNNCFITEGTGNTTHFVNHNIWYGVTNIYNWGGTDYATVAAFNTATNQGAQDQKVDPLLVNVGASNFHLLVGSPARGAGEDLDLTVDRDGVSVPAIPDIGAYQYV